MIFASIKNVGIQKLAMALLQQHGRSRTSALLHFFAQWGGLGVLPLAILDSTIIPTFGSLDILTAFLSARHSSLWVYYASMAVTGSMVGSYLTYKLGQKTGLAWFEGKFGERRSHQVEYALERWGAGAVFVSTVAPPPCPTSLFLLAAGGFHYNIRKFLLAVFSGRAIRYGLLTLIAAHYGRRIVRYMRHPGQYLWISLVVTVLIVAATVIFLSMRKSPSLVFAGRQVKPSGVAD
jgi:membrane protein YqaA with SNARE-associated domain